MQASRSDTAGPTVRGRAWRRLLEGHRDLVTALDAELKRRVGLDLQYYDVMVHVIEGGGGRRMTDLAEAVVLSKSGLTSLVDRMERDGLIERRADPEDRRATRIALTKEGEARYREASACHREIVHRIFTSHVTDEEARVIAETLERVRRELAGDGADGAIGKDPRG
jgi:DNA-binding MarR family transcriptional regulator